MAKKCFLGMISNGATISRKKIKIMIILVKKGMFVMKLNFLKK